MSVDAATVRRIAHLSRIAVAEGEAPLGTGAHGIERTAGAKRSLGYVTSSYFSPTLGRPIALGLIEAGDVLVLLGTAEELAAAELRLLKGRSQRR